jgi:hypothetical protein
MRGHHSTPPTAMKTNKKNDYLSLLNFVMQGGWEVVIDFQKDGKSIHTETMNIKI